VRANRGLTGGLIAAAILGDDRIDALGDPAGYLGSAQAMVRSAVGVAGERTDAEDRDGIRRFDRCEDARSRFARHPPIGG
jgi:hypothetical protein